MSVAHSTASRCAPAMIAAFVALAVSACRAERDADAAPTGDDPSATRRSGAASALAVASSGVSANACVPTRAHGKHAAQGYGCAVCHACAGTLAFSLVTLPGGSSTANGTVTRGGSGTTCLVGCHAPRGAELRPVAWDAGALECTSCHNAVTTTSAIAARSTHAVGVEVASATCRTCHDVSQHTSGQVRLVSGNGAAIGASCTGCHRGEGQTLAGRTPPLLVGWSDAVAGDFHGPRAGTCRFDALDAAGQRTIRGGGKPCPAAQPEFPDALRITSRWWYQTPYSGPWVWTCDIETVDASGNPIAPTRFGQPCPEGTILNSQCNNPAGDDQCHPTTLVRRGFGGTLLPPYDRGEDPLPCGACHDFHASTNAFLLASTVNGVPVAPGTIDRAGVGAQGLCNACHAGERHELCKSCHKEVWTTDGEYSWFEGAPVDPAPDGSACFYCHGHEGLRFMLDVSPEYPDGDHPFGLAGRDKGEVACSHCHSAWTPPPTEYVAPAFYWGAPEPTITRITATSAYVSWRSIEPATTYVEYGVGAAGYVVGSADFTFDHAVALTNLTPGTTYVWRVRTSDKFRNVTHTELRTFTTTAAGGVPFPDLAPVNSGVEAGTYTLTVALPWFPVTAPSGTAVEYEVQLASDPGFTELVNGLMEGPDVPGSTIGDSGWVSGSPTTVDGRPALSHPATLTNIPQDYCGEIVPNVYYWRVRARDQQGNVSDWSPTGTFGAFAGDPLC